MESIEFGDRRKSMQPIRCVLILRFLLLALRILLHPALHRIHHITLVLDNMRNKGAIVTVLQRGNCQSLKMIRSILYIALMTSILTLDFESTMMVNTMTLVFRSLGSAPRQSVRFPFLQNALPTREIIRSPNRNRLSSNKMDAMHFLLLHQVPVTIILSILTTL